jgi:LEA14-like dessication related protein
MKLSLIITTIFLLSGLSSCRQLKDPILNGIENVRVNQLGLKGSLITLDLKYFNPNKINARLKEAVGDAWVDSSFLGHFRIDTLVNIPGHSDFTIPVKLHVDMKDMLKHSLITFRKEQVLITIKGKAKLGKSGIFKNYPLSYQGNQNLLQLFK